MSGVHDSVILREQAERQKREEKRRRLQAARDAYDAAKPFLDLFRKERDLAQAKRGARGTAISFPFIAEDGTWEITVPWNREILDKEASSEWLGREMENDPIAKGIALIQAGNDYYDELLEEEERAAEALMRDRPRWQFWRRFERGR